MASIFKRHGRKNEPYTIQYLDHLGKRRTKKGFTDKGLTEQLAGKLEGDARLRTTGLIDPEQERYAEQKLSPIADHLAAFEESQADNSPKYVSMTMNQVRRIVKGADFKRLAEIEPAIVQTYLRSLRKTADIGHRTYNQYLQSMDTFLYWCVSAKRLIANPLMGMERLNTEVDVRRKRRALTADEVGKLVSSARKSGIRIQRFTGEQRARVYILSYMTGLRKSELASLTPRSFNLDAQPPTLTVEAQFSKHRRKDVLPLHPELVVMLRAWLNGVTGGEKLFPGLKGKRTGTMVRKDLERVGIAFETDEGVADFHAAGRHSHITELLRNGATLPEAKELARHSDIKMTMRYTHVGMADRAKAVANLKAPKCSPEPAAGAAPPRDSALHGRCISGGFESPSLAQGGTGREHKNSEKSFGSAELDTGCHSASHDGNSAAAVINPAARWGDRRKQPPIAQPKQGRSGIPSLEPVALKKRARHAATRFLGIGPAEELGEQPRDVERISQPFQPTLVTP
jgi:integrase